MSQIPPSLNIGPRQSLLTPLDDDEVLFKFLPAQFAEGLVTRGNLRIGTLLDFRSIEKHGPARGDDREGDTGSLAVIDDMTLTPGSPTSPYFRRIFGVSGPNQVRIQNSIIEEVAHDRDYFVYSTSKVMDKRLFKDFSSDTCVRIRKPRSFFRTLSEALSERIAVSDEPVGSMSAVSYGSKYGPYNAAFNVPGPYLKPFGYHYQHEVRLLWTPRDESIDPFETTVPGLCAHCDITAVAR